jgi:putative acetyltransferase
MIPTLTQATSPADYALALTLIQEYADTLAIDLCFQDFADECAQLSTMYGPPKQGALWIAHLGAAAVGVVALRRHTADTGEVKRLYVRPAARGHHVGRHLLAALMAAATGMGYRRLILDTLPDMQSAQSLYRALGFTLISPYYDHPVPNACFFERRLGP